MLLGDVWPTNCICIDDIFAVLCRYLLMDAQAVSQRTHKSPLIGQDIGLPHSEKRALICMHECVCHKSRIVHTKYVRFTPYFYSWSDQFNHILQNYFIVLGQSRECPIFDERNLKGICALMAPDLITDDITIKKQRKQKYWDGHVLNITRLY